MERNCILVVIALPHLIIREACIDTSKRCIRRNGKKTKTSQSLSDSAGFHFNHFECNSIVANKIDQVPFQITQKFIPKENHFHFENQLSRLQFEYSRFRGDGIVDERVVDRLELFGDQFDNFLCDTAAHKC